MVMLLWCRLRYSIRTPLSCIWHLPISSISQFVQDEQVSNVVKSSKLLGDSVVYERLILLSLNFLSILLQI